MQTIKLSYPHDFKKENLSETVVAIGFFDGVHEGHQTVIRKAVEIAEETGRECAVMTFYPHPSVILRKDAEKVHYISTLAEKEVIMEELGVDRLYIVTFNKDLSQLSPRQFLQHFIHDLQISHMVAGFDYTFGHKGAGNMDNIKEHTQEPLELTVIKQISHEESKVSSTSIRTALKEGDVSRAHTLLGRPYSAIGTVIKGDQRGRTLGFPTANLQIDEDKLLPKVGVYAVKVMYEGKEYKGMANIGYKPTFRDDMVIPSVEVYILDFDEMIYGEELTVYWHTFIRSEQKFNGVDEIITQLQTDEKNVRKYFSN
ncbi:MAG TPA: bifunctional riboflavin kinase/FAD synthetase [Pseudogracilibacillus sp.]|nr:bifunctional riboflavin kinase/FAD synthetase [Pseudogracilibacillus sp.]